MCGSSHGAVSTVITSPEAGSSLRQSPDFTSVALTVPLSKINRKATPTTIATTQSAESTRPAIAIPRPPWPFLARFSPTMPQITLISTPPRTPKINAMTAHQLVPGVGGACGPGGGG